MTTAHQKVTTMKIMNTVFAAGVLLLSSLAPAMAQSTAFTVNGRLNTNGAPVSGAHEMQFTLYDMNAGGNVIAGPLAISPVNVTNGLFTVRIDFGANVFAGPARWLDISVRPVGGASFVALTPRQEVTSAPYAIRAQTAATAADVNVGTVVKSLNGLRDDVTLAAGPNVTLTPNGNTLTIASSGSGSGGIWNLNGVNTYYTLGNVGIGTDSPTNPGVRLEVNGNARVTPGGSGGFLQIGSPNGETGLSFQGANRADIRYDGSILKLVAGTVGPPAPEAGIAINALGNVGIGTTTPTDGVRLEINGNVRVTPAGSGGFLQIGTPNGETGFSFQGDNRADIRYDGSILKLVAGTVGPPAPEAGIAINTLGNVGIGTTAPAHKLSLIGGPLWTSYSWGGALELGNASAIGWQADAGGQRFGIGQSTGGLYVFHTASDPGTTGSPANYDLHVTDTGNVTQSRTQSGLVKAMIYVNQDASIARCYNGMTDVSTGKCGFTVTRPTPDAGTYLIDFGFQVNDRFISVTPQYSYGANVGATFTFNNVNISSANQVLVRTYIPDVTFLNSAADASFMIIVY